MKLFAKFLALLLCLMLPVSAYAAPEANYNEEAKVMTVTGTISADSAGSFIGVHMYKSGVSDGSVAFGIAKIDADGSYGIEFNLPETADSGKYVVDTGIAYGKDTVLVYDLGNAEATKTVAALNSAGEAQFADIFKDEQKAATLGIDTAEEEYLADLCALVYGVREAGDTAYDYAEKIEYMRAVAEIINEKDVSSTLANYADSFDAAASDYEALSDGLKAQVDNVFYNYDFKKGMVTLEEIISVAKIKCTDGYDAVMAEIEKNTAVFDIDLSEYNKLPINDRHKAPKAVYDKKADLWSTADVKAVFDKAVSDSSSGSGGSNSEGSGTGASRPNTGGNSSPVTVGGTGVSGNSGNSGNGQGTKLSDISSSFAKTEIEALVKDGIISGYTDGTYRPESYVTRAEYSAMLCRAFALSGISNISFGDVNSDDWYYEYVQAMAAKGYILGDGSDFNPNDFITRQDAAVIACRIMKLADSEYPFADNADMASYAIGKIGAMANSGYLKGDGINFYPLKSITRAEAAALIYRIYNS